jgi:hypothetical protein
MEVFQTSSEGTACEAQRIVLDLITLKPAAYFFLLRLYYFP